MSEVESKKVLITVMTYPHPSRSHHELVCTAGITEDGEWIRLYPIDYRYRNKDQQFRKYQWIKVDVESSGAGNDNRKESRRPHLKTMELIGDVLPPWEKRLEIVNRLPHLTRNQLVEQHQIDKTSLGIVKPTKIHDMIIKPADPEWKPEWQVLFNQMKLFGPQQKPLRKIPYSFHYVFECEDSAGKQHTAMCEDWELGVLFLKQAERLGSEKEAAESVREKFFTQMCSEKYDTRFFMGTLFPYNVWLVLGVFWPPLDRQEKLF